MGKSELIAAMAEQTGFTKATTKVVLDALLDTIKEELAKGRKVQIVGFGTFETSERAEREGHNPQTGETMVIPAARMPKFKAGKALKDAVNE